MSLQQSKIESRKVSRRVQQTKKEIEQLKTELEKLINKGINHSDNVNNDNYNRTNNVQSKLEDQISKNVPSVTHTTQDTLPINKNTPSTLQEKRFTKITYRPRVGKSPQKSPSKEPEPRKKERHYNVEEAREYIKKQKEKRMDMLKSQVKQSQNSIDLRKEKLKDLQAKSLQLVKKNVEKKREKSKSRENLANKNTSNVMQPAPISVNAQKTQEEILPLSENHFDANGCLVPDLIVNNIKHIKEKCPQMPLEENVKVKHLKNIHPHLENITVRTYDLNLETIPQLQPPKQSLKYNFRHNAASVKIQAAYRGYRQRKLYKATIKMKRKLEEEARKLAEDAMKRQVVQKSEVNLTKENYKTETPFWLETVTKPYPYNFINAVKRKLNFSINPPAKTPTKTYSDVAVQSSELLMPQTINKQEIKILVVDPVKTGVDKSNASFLSHKHLDLNLRHIEGLQLQIKSDVKGCDIEENSLEKLGSTNKNKSSKLTTKASESSGSDTSKNIPDLSSESIDNLCSSNTGHSNSDANLGIDLDRLKDLRLNEKISNGSNNDFKLFKVKSRRDIPVEDNMNFRGLLDRNETVKKFEEYASTKKNSISLEHIKHFKSNNLPSNNSDAENESHSSKQSAKSISTIKSSSLESRESQIRLKNASQNFDEKIWNGCNSSKSKHNSITIREKSTQNDDIHYKLDVQNKSEPISSIHDDSRKSKSQSNYSNNTDQVKVPESFKSLLSTGSKSSDSIKTSLPSKQTNNFQANYSSNFSNTTSSVPSLKRPTDTLTTSQHSHTPKADNHNVEKNVILLRPGEITCFETKTNTNQIHLKFEAELHLLNDFNESLRQFMAVEKDLLELHAKTPSNTTIYHHQDTQTSALFQTEAEPRIINSQSVEKLVPTINYTRGSEVIEDTNEYNLGDSFLHPTDKTLLTTGLDLSEMEDSVNSSINETRVLGKDGYGGNVFAGLSLGMFDQLIKDEDSRIENLKTILKIREKALLDRTKGELAWLEIQKKQLIETGQLHEASLLKKKQRGIVIKLQHEKQEMQRLKQMQKAASKERKIILKEQRNMIKAQLSSGNIITKIKKNVQKDRTRTGPVKVYNLHRETVNTETSISKRNSATEELIITSRSASTVSRISDCAADLEYVNQDSTMKRHFSHRTEHTKRFLLMREAALQKRRKAAEDLLQWHQRLLEEERKIAELEMAANTIINKVPVDNMKEKYTGKDSQLNSLWLNMQEVDPKLKDEEIRKSTKKHTKHSKILINNQINESLGNSVNNKTSDLSKTLHTEELSDADSNSNIKSRNSEETTIKSIPVHIEIENSSLNKSITDEPEINTNQSSISYTSEFESPEVAEEKTSPTQPDVIENEIDRSKSTLHEIMQNISNITDEISAIYKLSCTNTSKNDSPAKISNNDTQEDSNIFYANDVSNSTCKDSIFINHGKSNNLQSQIVKSLSELIKTQSPCQDIRSLRERSIIETPEAVEPKNKLNESQNTLASSSELQTNLPEVETEENNKNKTVGVSDSEIQSNKQNNVDSGVEKMISLVQNHVSDINQINEEYQSEDTIISDLSSLNQYSKSDTSINNTESNKSTINSVKSAQVILDLSYGFVPPKKNSENTDENQVETLSISESHEKQTEIKSANLSTGNTLNNLFQTHSTNIIKTINEISEVSLNKDDTEVPENLSLNISEEFISHIENNVVEDVTNKSNPSLQENCAPPDDTLENDLNILNSYTLETKINEKEETCSSVNLLSNHLDTTLAGDMSQYECTINEKHPEKINDNNFNENEIVNSPKSELRENTETEVEELRIELAENTETEIEEKLVISEDNTNTDESTNIEEESGKTNSDSASVNQKKNFTDGVIDVKKRVSEILADANNSPREDKSPRLQDIYTTTYDITSPDHSPETGSPIETERSLLSVTQLYGEEAEALFKKQLAIEQEIKQLEQQQKEQIPYLYLREIPNKPPPPYTPPSSQFHNTHSVLPQNAEQIDILTANITDILYEAYSGGYLQSCAPRNKINSLNKSNTDKECFEFVFDLCKELALDHYKQFVTDDKPCWLKIIQKSQLAKNKPYDKFSLKQYLDKKIKELLGFEKVQFKENAIIKWSRKKRDHVDELLVLESQTEESEWTNYDEDEIIVKNEVTNDIMNMLLQETTNVMNTILRKRTFLY